MKPSPLTSSFFDKIHRFCPLFIEPLSPIDTYIHESFLFWVIIRIAAHTSNDRAAAITPVDLGALDEELKNLVRDLVIAPGRTPGVVQGLLLLAEYGFDSVRQKDDGSYTFSNLVCLACEVYSDQ